ncbi:YfcC family protein [Clostridium sp. DL1XJH146]
MASSVKANKVKGKFKIPNTYTLIVLFVIVAVLLTYIIPAGQYETIVDEITGKTLIDPASFHFIERTPVGVMGFLLSITDGMTGAASIIFLVFLVGGYFQIINDTGAIDAAINLSVNKLEKRAILVIPVLMAIMSVLGALGIIVNASIAFIPIGIALAKKLKLDPIVGMSIMYLGAYSGFTASPMGPFNTILGQTIAGIPPMSGFTFRSIVWAIIFIVSVWYVIRYSKKLQDNIENSVLEEIEWAEGTEGSKVVAEFNVRHALVLITLIAGFVLYTYGSFKLKWGLNYLSAVMLGVAIIAGIITKMNPDDMAKSFIAGCKSMVYGALVIGFAKAITIVLTDGNIIHSIIYYMSMPLAKVPAVISGVFMFYINLIFNFFVPSGSGQAMVVMPLMAPMADVVNVSRQVAVSAYQYGDGFSNVVIPTSGVLMAALGVAKIPYEKWLKFMMPLFGIWVLIGTIAIAVGTLIGWS